MQTIYEKELQQLKDWDEVQNTVPCNGFDFIVTAGHGYLVVPNTHQSYNIAKTVWEASGYGFVGTYAIYLEEDCEADTFLKTDGAII